VHSVCIRKQNDLTARRSCTGFACPLLSKPAFGERSRFHDSYARISGRELARDIPCAVGRSIIDDDKLEPRITA